MKPVNKELVQELYTKHDNWNDRTNAYNEIMNENRTANTLSSNYSENRRRAIKQDKNYIEEKTHVSERYLELNTTKLVTEVELLQLHGYDADLWEITSSNSTRSKIGTKANDEQYFINTYSKITVKPREFKLTKEAMEEILNTAFNTSIKKVIERTVSKSRGYMLIPFKDMHIKTAKQYEKHQQELYNIITSQGWKEIAFIIGSDLFNTNDSKGNTYNDTHVDNMNTTLSYRMNEARKFYEPLIDAALEQSMKVKIIYEPGNHDRDTALTFATALSWIYEDTDHIEFDLEDEDYKLITFNNGRIAIPTHHGDVKSTVTKAAETFRRYFDREIALADYSEGLIGHKHHRWSGEHMNLFIQGLSTAADETKWERKMGFGKGYKAFMIRLYDDYGLKDTPIINGSSIE